MDELEKAVNILKDNKSLGLDDLPGKFYKMFWVYIKDYLLDAFKESYNDGQLPLYNAYCSFSKFSLKREINFV